MSIGEILRREPESDPARTSKVGPDRNSGSFRRRGVEEPIPFGTNADSAEMVKFQEAVRMRVSAYLSDRKLFASAAFTDDHLKGRIAHELHIPMIYVGNALKDLAQNVKPTWKIGR